MQTTDGVEVAVDYYKHGIRVNPASYSCVYNLACVYLTLNKALNAAKWFGLAIKVAPLQGDSYFGAAVSYFKLKDY